MQKLNQNEVDQINGAGSKGPQVNITTLMIGEEGGNACLPPISVKPPVNDCGPVHTPSKPITTLALGEEGGADCAPVTVNPCCPFGKF